MQLISSENVSNKTRNINIKRFETDWKTRVKPTAFQKAEGPDITFQIEIWGRSSHGASKYPRNADSGVIFMLHSKI